MTLIRTHPKRNKVLEIVSKQGVLIALALLVLFGALRYDGFFAPYNVSSVLRDYSMYGLVALGMCFVILSGGIDLSVGSVVALSSVLAAKLSPQGALVALLVPMLAGVGIGLINGLVITRLNLQPFIATLAMLLGARGLALLVAGNQSVGASTEGSFSSIGQGNLLDLRLPWNGEALSVPIPAVLLLVAFILGSVLLSRTAFGRYALAIGGNEDASRLMGLPVDRVKIGVYMLSGALAGLSGVILASQSLTGQPTEGLGWELTAIASVVVGGTLLTGGMGSVWNTLAGAILLGLIFNILNFENGKGVISLSPYWQSVIRGAFLLLVVVLQNRLSRGKAG